MALKSLFIEKTEKTPEIDFSPISGELIMSGRSIPSNAVTIYGPAYDWIKEYVKKPHKTTNLRLYLEYFNTSSTIWIAKIIRALSSIKNPEYTFIIHMYISNDEMSELDEDDVKDILTPIIDINNEPTVSLCIKLYGTKDGVKVDQESTVFL